VQGRERIYLDRFWNELSANPRGIDEATRQHYASLYARPHAIHDAFEQFGAFQQDAVDNKALLAGSGSTTVVAGDPSRSGPYTIRLSIPANSRIQAHTHRDNRTAVVVAGTWYFGYGPVAGAAAEKALRAGSFYTEPAGVAHFAETKAEPVLVYITGNGPTDTVYVDASDAPAAK
jgi:quercetin dioxygenase-like cupin family protein